MALLGGPSNNNSYAQLRNNAAAWWFQDAGLRKLAVAMLVGFMSIINGGYYGSLMNGLLANPLFGTAIDNLDGNKLGLISASYSLGGIIGIFPAPFVADRFGRRWTVTAGAVFIIAGGLVQTFTTGGYEMLAGRLIVGIGSSFQGIGGGPLVAELSHPRNRPQCTALINTCWYIGSIIAAWVTFGALDIVGSWSWRLCCLIQVVPASLQLFLVWFIEESPRWLVSKGREEKALQVLAKYHANGDQEDELVELEFQEIREAIAKEKAATEGVSLKSFVKTKGNRHRLIILICVAFYSQWVGNGIISYYLAKILTSVGITNPTQQAGFNGGLQIFNWLAAIGGSLASEKLGRRFLWLTSATGMLVSFIIITAFSAVYAKIEAVAAGRAVMAFLFIYFGFYDIAFTGLTVSYPLEILSFSLRAKGMAVLNFFIYAALYFNQYVNPIALDAIAWKYYFVYIGVLSISIASIYFLYPENQGCMLEEVAEIFDGPSAELIVSQKHFVPDDSKVVRDEEKRDISEHMEHKG